MAKKKLPAWATWGVNDDTNNENQSTDNEANFLNGAKTFLANNDSKNNLNTLRQTNFQENLAKVNNAQKLGQPNIFTDLPKLYQFNDNPESKIESQYKAFTANNPINLPKMYGGTAPNIFTDNTTTNSAPKKVVATPTKESYFQSVLNGDKQLNLSTLLGSKAPTWQKAVLSPLAGIGTVGNYLNDELQNNDGTISGNKFTGRLLDTARSAATAGAVQPTKQIDTGNKVENFVADMLGSAGGFSVPNGGLSMGNSISPIGEGVEKGVTKLLPTFVSPVANKLAGYGVNALKGTTEFGTLNGVESGLNGDNTKTVLKNIGSGALQGALFNTGSKAIGDVAKLPSFLKDTKNNTIANIFEKKFPTNTNLKPQNVDSNVLNKGNVITPLNKLNSVSEPNTSTNLEVPTKLSMNIVSSDKNNKLNAKDIWNKFYTGAIDKNKSIADFSKAANDETYIKATNAANTPTIVNHIMDNALVDTKGKPIDISYKELVSSLPKDKTDFSNYLLQLHNIDRNGLVDKAATKLREFESQNQSLATMPLTKVQELAKQSGDNGVAAKEYLDLINNVETTKNKPIDANYTSQQSQKAVQEILKQHPEYKEQGQKVTGWINKFMSEWGNKTGLISDDLWKSLNDTYKNYIPTNRDFTDIEGLNPSTNGKGFTGQNVPLKKATGSSRDIVDPFESTMNTINRTVKSAKYNEVAQSMLDSLKKNPEGLKNWGEIIPEGTEINPNVNNIVTVLDKGKKVNVQINNKDLLKTLEGFQKTNNTPIQDTLKKATQPYKDLITTKNPFFTVRNVARDLPTAYINGSESNPLKFGKNYISAIKDLATNSDIAKQYNAIGGGGSNFDYTGNTAKDLKTLIKQPNIFQKVTQGIEKVNNLTESAPRLAEFKNTLAKGGSLDKALYNANDITTNFSRGGNVTKTIDSGVPYLNAGVQGIDKEIRQFKDNPLGTIAKGVGSITVPTLALNYINRNNPNYQALDNRTKDNYFLFPNPVDSGKTFIKIPKSRELGVLFGSLAERVVRATQGEKNSFKGFGNTALTNIAPSNPIENNIISPLAYNIPKNKDFANRTIVPQGMQDLSPKYQYDNKTSEIAKKIGDLTNLSPKQIDYVIKSYTGVIGQIVQPATTKTGNPLNTIATQFTADPRYSNQNMTDFYDNMQKAKTNAADKNFTGKIDPKTTTPEEYLSSDFTKASKQISDLSKKVTLAQGKGDTKSVNLFRDQMNTIAKETNKYMDNPQQYQSPSLLKSNIDALLKNKSDNDSKYYRNEAKAISKDSSLSTEDKNKKFTDIINFLHGGGSK